MDNSCCNKPGLLSRLRDTTKYYWNHSTDNNPSPFLVTCQKEINRHRNRDGIPDEGSGSKSAFFTDQEKASSDLNTNSRLAQNQRDTQYDICEDPNIRLKDKSKC